MDDDDGDSGVNLFDCSDEVGGGHLRHFRVHHDSVDCRESPEGGERLLGAVGGENVELGGFDDELAGGYASRVFVVNNEKAWSMCSVHRSMDAELGLYVWTGAEVESRRFVVSALRELAGRDFEGDGTPDSIVVSDG